MKLLLFKSQKCSLCCFCILISGVSPAQQPGYFPDARLRSLCLADLVSGPWGNPAGMTSDGDAAHFHSTVIPRLEGAGEKSVHLQRTGAHAAFGFGVRRFGDDAFSHQALSLTASHRVASTRVGFRVEWNQFRSVNRLSRVVAFQLGSVTEIRPGLRIGVMLENPGFAQWGDASLPVRLSAGLMLSPSRTLSLYTALQKDLLHPPSLRSAMEWEFRRGIMLRSGFQLVPSLFSVGSGFHYWKVTADYGFQYARHTGPSFQASVRYMIHGNRRTG